MVETAEAFGHRCIVRSSSRIVAANIGGEDFATDCGMEPAETCFTPTMMVIAAASAGVMPSASAVVRGLRYEPAPW